MSMRGGKGGSSRISAVRRASGFRLKRTESSAPTPVAQPVFLHLEVVQRELQRRICLRGNDVASANTRHDRIDGVA